MISDFKVTVCVDDKRFPAERPHCWNFHVAPCGACFTLTCGPVSPAHCQAPKLEICGHVKNIKMRAPQSNVVVNPFIQYLSSFNAIAQTAKAYIIIIWHRNAIPTVSNRTRIWHMTGQIEHEKVPTTHGHHRFIHDNSGSSYESSGAKWLKIIRCRGPAYPRQQSSKAWKQKPINVDPKQLKQTVKKKHNHIEKQIRAKRPIVYDHSLRPPRSTKNVWCGILMVSLNVTFHWVTEGIS